MCFVKGLNILADENIAGLDIFFGEANVTTKSGRDITADDLEGIEALLLRSVTKVDEELLEKADALKFIGSATIGIDHIDQTLLHEKNIRFAYAPGCNSQAVCEYVVSAIATFKPSILNDNLGRVGLVGYGNVGSKVYSFLHKRGVDVCVYDPFKQKSSALSKVNFVSYEDALACDVVSFHVPLTNEGEHPTHKMLNTLSIPYIKSNGLLINTSRGDVFDESALLDYASQNQDLKIVLDVWENEPFISGDILQRVDSASPHIAGYSMRGKWRGTLEVYRAICLHFGFPLLKNQSHFPLVRKVISVKNKKLSDVFLAAFDNSAEDMAMRELFNQFGDEAGGQHFDMLRKQYQQRCEWEDVVCKETKKSLHDYLLML